MSYSNDWSVTGITGISSLKECYKWNGSNRLYDFGMLRLKDDDVKVDTHTINILFDGKIPISIDGTISTNNNYSSYFRYYAIPGYLINNKNITAVGITNDSDEENAYNHVSMEYSTTEENSKAKNWKYIKYPTFISFLDSFSSFWKEQIYPGDARVNQNIFYDKDGRWVAMLQSVYNNNFTDYTADLSNYIVASYYHNILGNVVGDTAGTDTYTLEYMHLDNGDNVFDTRATVRLRYQSTTALVFKNGNNVEITDTSLKSKLNKLFNIVSVNLRSNEYGADKGFNRSIHGTNYYFEWRMSGSIECLNTNCYFPYYYKDGIYPEAFDGNKSSLTTNFNAITGENQTRFSNVWFNVYSNLRTNNQTIDIDPYFKGWHMHYHWNHLQVKDGTTYSIPWRDNGDNPKIWRSEYFPYYFSYDYGDFYIQESGQGHGWVIEEWPLWEELAYYGGYVHDDEPWITLHQSQYAQYTCPLILSSEPAICFERVKDSRNNNTYAYKVYIGNQQATTNNFGSRKIKVYLYKIGLQNRTTITITLGQDSSWNVEVPGETQRGQVYWDSYESTSGQPLRGCLIFRGPGENFGNWQGFGAVVNLCPVFFGDINLNSEYSSSTYDPLSIGDGAKYSQVRYDSDPVPSWVHEISFKYNNPYGNLIETTIQRPTNSNLSWTVIHDNSSGASTDCTYLTYDWDYNRFFIVNDYAWDPQDDPVSSYVAVNSTYFNFSYIIGSR